jgi:hypothetical protein
MIYITGKNDIIRLLELTKMTSDNHTDNCKCLTCNLVRDLKNNRVNRLDILLNRLRKVRVEMCITEQANRVLITQKITEKCNCNYCELTTWCEQRIRQVMVISEEKCRFCGK